MASSCGEHSKRSPQTIVLLRTQSKYVDAPNMFYPLRKSIVAFTSFPDVTSRAATLISVSPNDMRARISRGLSIPVGAAELVSSLSLPPTCCCCSLVELRRRSRQRVPHFRTPESVMKVGSGSVLEYTLSTMSIWPARAGVYRRVTQVPSATG